MQGKTGDPQAEEGVGPAAVGASTTTASPSPSPGVGEAVPGGGGGSAEVRQHSTGGGSGTSPSASGQQTQETQQAGPASTGGCETGVEPDAPRNPQGGGEGAEADATGPAEGTPEGAVATPTQYVQYNVGNCSVVVSDNYVVTSLLGTGSYGVVVEAKRVKPGRGGPGVYSEEGDEMFAIKKLRLGEVGDTLEERLSSTERVLREIKLLAHFDHYTIVSLHDLIRPRDHDLDLCYVMDLMSTDLGCLLHPQLRTPDYIKLPSTSPDCGLTFDDHNVLQGVADGSPAHSAGFAEFVGRRALVIDNRLRFSTNSPQYRVSAQKVTHASSHKSVQIGFEPEKQEFELSSLKTIMWSVLEAFALIHACGVIHRDAKPQNILLSHDGVVKLCDFGLARELDNDASLTSYVETRWYRAPELLVECTKYDAKVDVWSLGCIFAELLHPHYDPILPGFNTLDQLHLTLDRLGKPTVADLNELGIQSEKTRTAILGRDTSPHSGLDALTPDPLAVDLLRQMLCFLPGQRITVEGCMRHPFFKDYKDEEGITDADCTAGEQSQFCLAAGEAEGSAPPQAAAAAAADAGEGAEGGGAKAGVCTAAAGFRAQKACLLPPGSPEALRHAAAKKRQRLSLLTRELIETVRGYHPDFTGDFLLQQLDGLLGQ